MPATATIAPRLPGPERDHAVPSHDHNGQHEHNEGSVNRLQRLIRDRMNELRISGYSEVARLTGIPRSTVHSLATREQLRQVPRPDTLDALAHGLNLPIDVVRDAAAEAAGYLVESVPVEDDEMRVFVATVRQLSDADRRRLAKIAQMYLDEMRDSEPEGDEH